MKILLLSILLLSGCAAARGLDQRVGSGTLFRYILDYSTGMSRVVDAPFKGQIEGCALIFDGRGWQVIFPFSWVTRIVQITDPVVTDHTQTKSLE